MIGATRYRRPDPLRDVGHCPPSTSIRTIRLGRGVGSERGKAGGDAGDGKLVSRTFISGRDCRVGLAIRVTLPMSMPEHASSKCQRRAASGRSLVRPGDQFAIGAESRSPGRPWSSRRSGRRSTMVPRLARVGKMVRARCSARAAKWRCVSASGRPVDRCRRGASCAAFLPPGGAAGLAGAEDRVPGRYR